MAAGSLDNRGMEGNKERDEALVQKQVLAATSASSLTPSWNWEQNEQTSDSIQRELFRG